MPVAEKRSALENVKLLVREMCCLITVVFELYAILILVSGKRRPQLVHQRKLEVLVLPGCGGFTRKILLASKCKETLENTLGPT